MPSIQKQDGRVIHLNHAGASPSPPSVTACLSSHHAAEQALGGYQAASEAHNRLIAVYENAAKLIGATGASEIALVESATVGWTRLFYSFCACKEDQNDPTAVQTSDAGSTTTTKKRRQVILISEAEYAANVVAACQWANRPHRSSEWSVFAIPSKLDSDGKSTGKVNIEVLAQMLDGTFQCDDGSFLDPSSIAIVCITHVPTNSGIVNPVCEIGSLIAEYNQQNVYTSQQSVIPPIIYLLDSCQSIGQMNVNVSEIQCHGLVATGRKFLRGPRGTGFLYIPHSLANAIVPHHVDHYGMPVQRVPSLDQVRAAGRPVNDFLKLTPLPSAKRFEFWESNIANRLALGEALKEVLDRGIDTIQPCIHEHTSTLYKALQQIPGVELYYRPECGICTFSVMHPRQEHGAVDPTWIQNQLSEVDETTGYRFSVSVVPATSTPLDSGRTGAPNLIRASVSYTNTREQLVMFCERLKAILKTMEAS